MRLAPLVLAAFVTTVGCTSEWSPGARPNGAGPAFASSPPPLLPGPAGATRLPPSETEPEELPGVDTKGLVAREQRTWWQLVSQLYAPCEDQAVSIAQCVREARPCATCVPAAALLAQKVAEGGKPADVEAAYAIRFGPNVKKVDLEGSPTRGPADAPVVMVVWSDFECPACGRAVPLLNELARSHEREMRLVHKMYPLGKHKLAEPAARAGWAAFRQGKYWQMEEQLFTHQDALNEADLFEHAKKVGLDMNRFRADFASEAAKQAVQRDKAEADAAGLTGTPFILINGREFDTSYFRFDVDFEPWIKLEVELARGRGG